MTTGLGLRVANVLSAIVLGGTVTALAACVPLSPSPPPNRSDMLGVWEARADGHVVSLELHGDGTIQIDEVPRAVFHRDASDALGWGDIVDVAGTWSFTEPGDETSEAHINVLTDETAGGEWLTLYPRSGGLHLYYGDVEAGRHLTFAMLAAATTPPPATVSRADLVGAWTSPTDGELQLSGDGTFEISGGPATFLTNTDADGTDTPITPSGQWHFEEEVVPLDPETYVMLSFEGTYGESDTFVTKFLKLEKDRRALSLGFHDEASWAKS